MSSLPEWLQPLLDASILQDIASPNTINQNNDAPVPQSFRLTEDAPRLSVSRAIDFTGLLSSTLPFALIEPPTKGQVKAKRSSMLKAYAHSIRGLITPESDLGSSGQALFIASPLQKGVPQGVAEAYMNEAVFQHGNAVQSPLSPIYRAGVGDYFAWLNRYVSNIKDVFSTDSEADKQARNAYLDAKAAADEEYDKAVSKFAKVQALDPTVKFQDWMTQYATDYLEACKTRDDLAANMRHSSVKLAKEMFDDAQARLQPKQGNNMLCALSDLDILNAETVDTADTVYRPLYYLSGAYESTARRWRNEYSSKRLTPDQRIISFEGLKNKTWAQLGISQTEGDEDSDDGQNAGFEVTLKYTGMGVFDLKRGLWDINDFRTLLPELASSAPADCRQPIYKTSKLLLAYGVDLVVKLPQAIDENTAKKLRMMPGLLDDMPLTLVGGDELHAQPQTNDAYPVLLAVLAEKC